MSRIKIQRGSGNVFRDVGFPPAVAENMLLRAQLMSEIRTAARSMTQAQAAKLFGVTQPRLNDVLRGRIEKFSLDALVNMLAKGGRYVAMRVGKQRNSRRRPTSPRSRVNEPPPSRSLEPVRTATASG